MASEANNNDPQAVVINLLGKEYHIACPPGEKEALMKSAAYLDEKMRDIRQRGRTTSSDNIAVMAALNITHELLQKQPESKEVDSSFQNRVKNLQSKIETALTDARQIEI